jgi:hypothetical protein
MQKVLIQNDKWAQTIAFPSDVRDDSEPFFNVKLLGNSKFVLSMSELALAVETTCTVALIKQIYYSRAVLH